MGLEFHDHHETLQASRQQCFFLSTFQSHDDVIKWKHFPRYWPFVRGIHRPPVNYPHKGQWRGALMFSLICAWINGWVNNGEAGGLRCHRAHYDVTVMDMIILTFVTYVTTRSCICHISIHAALYLRHIVRLCFTWHNSLRFQYSFIHSLSHLVSPHHIILHYIIICYIKLHLILHFIWLH